jgi:phage-related protein
MAAHTWKLQSLFCYNSGMPWVVETLNKSVDDELSALSPDLRAKFVRVAELLESFGPQRVHEPHVKFLGDVGFPLWEMRLSGKTQIARALYVTQVNERIVVLHAFIKKTQKIPEKAFAMAKQRYKELIQSEKGKSL